MNMVTADSFKGHGYFSASGGPGNKTYPSQKGFPYDELDLEPDFQQEEVVDSEEQELADKINNKTDRKYMQSDRQSKHTRDRLTFTKPTLSLPGAVASESLIRMRMKSSEPGGSGTMYGWSSRPMLDKPQRMAGTKLPRFDDILLQDDEEQFSERERFLKHDAIEERILRNYIRYTLHYHNS